MKLSAKGVIALLLASTALPTASAADPVTGFVAGAAVDGVVQGVKNAALEVIQQMDSSVGTNSFRVRQDMSFLISELDYFATQHRNQIFSQLNASEKRFVTDTNNLILTTSRETRSRVKETSEIAGTLESAISRLPWANSQPRVSRSSPGYMLDNASGAAVRVAAEGNLLSKGHNARMTVAGKPCAAIGSIDTSLTFSCDGAAFRADTAVSAVTASLSMEVDQPWYSGICNSLTGKPAPVKTYRLLVHVVPRSLGTYRVEGVADEDYDVTEEQSGVVDASNDHCWGERRHGPFRFTPRVGWRVTASSIHEGVEHSGSGQRSLDGPLDVTESGFLYFMKLQNSGSCGPKLPFTNRRAFYDARGWMRKDIVWNEVQTRTHDVALPLNTGPMAWGTDIAIPLPDRMKQVAVTVDQLDGQHRVVTGDDAGQDWFSVSIDPNRRTLVIRPRSLEQAMAAN